MSINKEKVKLDEILKFLFSTSDEVLIKLLGGIFEENINPEEVELKVSNNEFVEDDLGILREKKMYPLIPLQLFNLRKELETAQSRNDAKRIKELTYVARNLADKLARESANLFEGNEILGEDFHQVILSLTYYIVFLE